jgi:hypothetical protein
MICVPTFPGDDDQRLFNIQTYSYWDSIWTVFKVARERYLYGESVLRSFGSMSIQSLQFESFDHRTIQDVHDLIAAFYRFKRRTESLFPLEPNLCEDWYAFLREEAVALCESADFVTGVLNACIYANTEVRYAGEKRANHVQRERYWAMLEYTLPRYQPEVAT